MSRNLNIAEYQNPIQLEYRQVHQCFALLRHSYPVAALFQHGALFLQIKDSHGSPSFLEQASVSLKISWFAA
ncbi:MAG: hypothetical protein DDT38_00127 [Firmicutes bacterium]|nr:hypothetical protein [candidate division NPL-UPA2 bacterium]